VSLSKSNACNSDNDEPSEGRGDGDDMAKANSVGISCPPATADATSERRARKTLGNTLSVPPLQAPGHRQAHAAVGPKREPIAILSATQP
jgi:hypothetical protein